MNSINFKKILLIACFILIFYHILKQPKVHLILGPMIGHRDSKSVLIWYALDPANSAEIRVSKNKDLSNARAFKQNKTNMSKFLVNKLTPQTKYYYQLSTNESTSEVFSFTTAPLKDRATKLRVLFSSCSGNTASDERLAWDEIKKINNIDIILQLGDNHYANTTDPIIMIQHYHERRSSDSYINVTARVPTYAIWDDHDFGPNDSHGQTLGKENSLAVFKKHWANPSFGESDNLGTYYSFHYGDIQFIMLDSRYHRTPNKSKKSKDPSKTLLGKKQFEWFKATMKTSTAKVKIVACGSEFQMFSTGDCFSGFKHEQKKILDICKETEGVLLISGDRHFTAAYQIRGETIEVTSGPLGSHTAKARVNRDMFMRHDEGKMFSIFDIDTISKQPKITLEVYRAGQGKIDEISFTWDEVNGKSQIKSLKTK